MVRRRRKLRSPWPFLSREPESAAGTGLPGLRVLEKCPARCTCVSALMLVSRVLALAGLQAAYTGIYRRGDSALLENIRLVNARRAYAEVSNPRFVIQITYATPLPTVIVTRCWLTPAVRQSSTPVRGKVFGDDSTRPCQPFCHRNETYGARAHDL